MVEESIENKAKEILKIAQNDSSYIEKVESLHKDVYLKARELIVKEEAKLFSEALFLLANPHVLEKYKKEGKTERKILRRCVTCKKLLGTFNRKKLKYNIECPLKVCFRRTNKREETYNNYFNKLNLDNIKELPIRKIEENINYLAKGISNRKIVGNHVFDRLLKMPETFLFLDNFRKTLEYPIYFVPEIIYLYLNKHVLENKLYNCVMCGAKNFLINFNRGYTTYCSLQCVNRYMREFKNFDASKFLKNNRNKRKYDSNILKGCSKVTKRIKNSEGTKRVYREHPEFRNRSRIVFAKNRFKIGQSRDNLLGNYRRVKKLKRQKTVKNELMLNRYNYRWWKELYDNMTLEEIANYLGLTKDTVRRSLARVGVIKVKAKTYTNKNVHIDHLTKGKYEEEDLYKPFT